MKSDSEIITILFSTIKRLNPFTDVLAIDPDQTLHFDLILQEIENNHQIAIPKSDYPKLTTLRNTTSYLIKKFKETPQMKKVSEMNLEEYTNYYSSTATNYPYLDDFSEQGQHWHRTEFYKRFLKDGQKVLDVGCSNGGLAKYITENYNVNLFAFDIAPFFSQNTQINAPKSICGTFAIESMPFCEACFDVIIAGEVLEHVLDFKVAIDQLKRVLKPSGYLITTTPSTHDSLDNEQHLRMVDPHLLEQHLPNVRVEYTKYSWLSVWQK